MAKVPISLSWYDIEHALERECGTCLADYPEEEIHKALYSIGFDLKSLEVEEVLHRPRYSTNNEPWNGNRFVAFERQDREWLFSGKSTLENIISAQEDTEHRKDLLLMSVESNNTLDIIEHMERNSSNLAKELNKK